MTRALADLPPEVQADLREKRRAIPGWAEGTAATADHWMAYYTILNTPAREYLVESLLELAQRGSNCLQADHDEMAESFWVQLRGVTELHNARVDEVAMLREHVRQLREALLEVRKAEEIPDELKAAEALEHKARVLEPGDLEMIEVNFTPNPLPEMQLYVRKPDRRGHSGQ